ncbi:MAG: hypothetical protein WC619_01990 [Patescibacteria group bacterium]
MANLFVPNSTQTPNIAIDFLMAHLPEAEFKALVYIYRRTFGFQKSGDTISLSQFTNGMTGKNREHLDYGTGLSKTSNIKAIASLKRLGLVLVIKTHGTNYYKPVLDVDIDFVLKNIPKLKKTTTEKIKERFNQLKLFA